MHSYTLTAYVIHTAYAHGVNHGNLASTTPQTKRTNRCLRITQNKTINLAMLFFLPSFIKISQPKIQFKLTICLCLLSM